jgi:hypothetical protein
MTLLANMCNCLCAAQCSAEQFDAGSDREAVHRACTVMEVPLDTAGHFH